MPSRSPLWRPVFWLGCALIVLPMTEARSDPIQMAISGNLDNIGYIIWGPISSQSITLPDGFSNPSDLGPIVLATSFNGAQEDVAGLPASQLPPNFWMSGPNSFDIQLTFQSPDSTTSSSIELSGTYSKTFGVANGVEYFSTAIVGTPQVTISQNAGTNSSIPLSLLNEFASAPLQLTGSMTSEADGNSFEISMSFGSGVETPEPSSLLVFGAGAFATWIARSLRSRRGSHRCPRQGT